MDRTLVVIPTYEEGGNIATVLCSVRGVADDIDILVVDDNSSDGTADIAEACGAELGRIHVLRRPRKAGIGSAYVAGFAWGLERGAEVLVAMDADQSHDAEVIPAFLEALARGADLVIGSRYAPGGVIPNWNWHRKALSRWGNLYAGRMLGLPIADATSGFRAYRAAMLQRVDLSRVRADGYGFQIEMAYIFSQFGARIVEVPICFSDRIVGRSKMSGRIVVEALTLVTMWGMRSRLSLARTRLRASLLT